MDIEKVKQEYNTQLSIRDSLPICEAEIAILEEFEEIQRYLRLKSYYEQNKHLKGKSDQIILDSVIAEDDQKITDDTYFCLGKDFLGHSRKVGGYYIEYASNPRFRLSGIILSKYRNLANPKDEVIIPTSETPEFEATHNILLPTTDLPSQEYLDLRRQLYQQAIAADDQILLRKEK